MPPTAPDASNPDFKSLLSKLVSAGWTDSPGDPPKTPLVIPWTYQGQLCLATLKEKKKYSPYWNEASAFAAALTEPEAALLQYLILTEVP